MGQPWREVPLCLLSKRSSEVAARAPARGGRRRRGRSFSQSEADDRDDGRSAVSAAPSARVPPAGSGSVAAPGLPRRRGSRSAMIRGGRAFREARARVRVHHQRVHQSSPATGPTRSRGRHVSRERPTATGPTRSSQDQTYSTNRRRTRFFFASAASKRSLNVSPTCCMANFSFSASSSSSSDQGTRDTGGRRVRRLGM